MPTREQTLDVFGVLATASMIAVGLFIGGHFGEIVPAGMGVAIGADILQRNHEKVKQWLSSSNGVLNHDIQQALARAFHKALSYLEQEYFNLAEPTALPTSERDSVKAFFGALKKQKEEIFVTCTRRPVTEQEVKQYMYADPGTSIDMLWDRLAADSLLAPYSKHFRDFLRANLLNQVVLWFGEELKTDSRECNKAWRAFQRLLLEGMHADVKALRGSQDQGLQIVEELRQKLDQLKGTIDRRSPSEPLLVGFEAAVNKIPKVIVRLEQKVEAVGETTQRTELKVDVIAADVKALMLQVFHRAQEPTDEQVRRQQAELERLRAQQSASDQRRREAVRERVVGPVPSAVVQHFKDRVPVLRSLREQLVDEKVRLVLVCGRGGVGKTALITKLLHDVQLDFTLHLDTKVYEVDSIVYVALRQSDFRSPDKIVELICRTLDSEAASGLRAKWQEKTSLADKLEFLFRRVLGARHYLMVLDNFEDVLDEENRVPDEFADLRQFLEKCLEYDHGVRIVATSRRTLVLESELEGRVGTRRAELPLDKGLPEGDAVALLRELDTDGRLGIKNAPDATLRAVAHRCHGMPRTLETLVGTLRQRRTWTLPKLLDDKILFARLVDNPAREVYENLSPEERLVMQALAIYDLPVPAAAVRYLLPALSLDDILDRLTRNYVVAYDSDQFSLHPLDQQYASGQIPDVHGDYSSKALDERAARFFHEIRRPPVEWKTIDDLEPQLREFHHLVRAGLYDRACTLLRDIDDDYLNRWGYYTLVVELRSSLEDHLTKAHLEIDNWHFLASALYLLGREQESIAYEQRVLAAAKMRGENGMVGCALIGLGLNHSALGDTPNAIGFFEQALPILRDIHWRRTERNGLNCLGEAYRTVGNMRKAIEYTEQALTIARETGELEGEANCLAALGETHADCGHSQKAKEYCERALEIFKRIRYRRNQALCLCILGDEGLRRGEFEESVRRFEEVEAIGRSIGCKEALSKGLAGLGGAYHNNAKPAEARRYYSEALELADPEFNSSCAAKLGVICLEEGRAEEAQHYFSHAVVLSCALLKKTPRHYKAPYFLALAKLGVGQFDEALTIYQEALSACAAKGIVQMMLCDLQLMKRATLSVKQLDEAIELLEQSLSRGSA